MLPLKPLRKHSPNTLQPTRKSGSQNAKSSFSRLNAQDKFDEFVSQHPHFKNLAGPAIRPYINEFLKEGKVPQIGRRTEIQDLIFSLDRRTDQAFPFFLANKKLLLQEAIRHDQPLLFKAGLRNENVASVINESDGLGFTPLSTAVLKHNEHAVRLLLNRGADSLKPDATGTTPLRWAAYSGNKDIYNQLITHLPTGKRMQAHQDFDPLLNEQTETAKQILSSPLGQRQTLFNQTLRNLQGVEHDDFDEYKKVIGKLSQVAREGVEIDSDMSQGCTPLMAASKDGLFLTIKSLLFHGADIDKGTRFGKEPGKTPLKQALQNGNYDLSKLLLDFNADPSKVEDKEGNALHHAAGGDRFSSDNDQFVDLLLKYGVDINYQNSAGDTPLHTATRASHTNFANKLMQIGADQSIANRKGETPLAVAFQTIHKLRRKVSFSDPEFLND